MAFAPVDFIPGSFVQKINNRADKIGKENYAYCHISPAGYKVDYYYVCQNYERLKA